MERSDREEKRIDTDEVLYLLDAYLASFTVCAAMELGLFWHLDRDILSREKIAGLLNLPVKRCQYWLQYLCKLGLLEQVPDGFSLSLEARSAILDSYSQDTWALLAKESREQFPVFQLLTSNFRDHGSLWEAAGLDPPKYVERMNEDPVRARQFTRMLYELHQPLAEEIANLLDMSQINQLMDLGGGSGVVSMALLRRNSHLSALVVDIPNVCSAGREIAEEVSLEERLIYHPADFIHDALPIGFDMVLECDVGVYSKELFNKVRESLNPSGRYVIIDQFAPETGVAPSSRIAWALQGSLIDSDFTYPTAEEIVSKLENSGYHLVTARELPIRDSYTSQFSDDIYIIEAHV
jgi:predicted TPR repeat methyltransferase